MATPVGKRRDSNPVSGQQRWTGGLRLRAVAECRRLELRSWLEDLESGPRAPGSSNVYSAPCARIAGETRRENQRPSVPVHEGDGNASEWLVAYGDFPHLYVLVMLKKSFVFVCWRNGNVGKLFPYQPNTYLVPVVYKRRQTYPNPIILLNIFQVIPKRNNRRFKLLHRPRITEISSQPTQLPPQRRINTT